MKKLIFISCIILSGTVYGKKNTCPTPAPFLTKLYATNCPFTVTCHDLVMQRKSITTLEPFPCYCGSTVQIENINLRDNLITQLPAQAFLQFTNLRRLDLENNQITQMDPQAFVATQGMVFLNLRFNRLTILKNRMLSPENNVIVTITPDGSTEITSAIKLRTLLIAYNCIRTIELYAFRDLGNLKELRLEHNQITVLQNNLFNDLILLEALVLNHNQISIIEQNAFQNLSALTYLDLSDNLLTDSSGLSADMILSSLFSLKLLDLRNNQFSQAFQEELSAALPDVTIKF